jgi:hypothetical protein
MVKINRWLENHARWPLHCNVLRAMRISFQAQPTRVKEVKEFHKGLSGSSL